MELFNLILKTLDVLSTERDAYYTARDKKIRESFSDKNNGVQPVRDNQGRYHAPFDGYIGHNNTTHLKGEYISIDTVDVDLWAVSKRQPRRVTFKGNDEQLSHLQSLSQSQSHFFFHAVQNGRSWINDYTGEKEFYIAIFSSAKVTDAIDDVVSNFKKSTFAARKAAFTNSNKNNNKSNKSNNQLDNKVVNPYAEAFNALTFTTETDIYLAYPVIYDYLSFELFFCQYEELHINNKAKIWSHPVLRAIHDRFKN